MSATALIVDDEADLCKLMQITLTKMGLKSDVAYDLHTAYELFNNNEYDFCLTDLALPDGSGIDLVKKVVNSDKNVPIAVITAHGTVDIAIEALKLGAFDFVNKPLEITRLRQIVQNALKVATGETTPKESISPEDKLLNERLIGTSEPMLELRTTIKKVAKSQAPVFLSGASGTGKEVVAKLIHDLSPRREGSFVPVNCGAIPSELVESEFFGHKKGSFTGATGDKIGLFQQANGGTLFLDEVADLPLVMQVKLLRAIQEKSVRAIGDTKEVPVDVRILSATHKDLQKLIQQGQFRQDLFYRINVIMVKLPLLNERREDISLLANHFLSLIANDWGIELPSFSDAALAALKSHNFEGNVRELRNILERAITMSENSVIDVGHLFINQPNTKNLDNTRSQESSVASSGYGAVSTNTAGGIKMALNYSNGTTNTISRASSLPIVTPLMEDESEFLLDKGNLPTLDFIEDDKPVLAAQSPSLSLPKEGLEAYLLEQEKTLIIAALNEANGNKTQAAKLLGMSFRSLRYRMKKLEIDSDDGH